MEELINNEEIYMNIKEIFLEAPNHLEGLLEVFYYGYNYERNEREEEQG